MVLSLEGGWVWDFWLVRDGEDVHLFHLWAPTSLGDPESRHLNARIGHAVSRDLRTWKHLGRALPDASDGAPDDLATWTGCVVRQGELWHMIYTGISRAEGRSVQRIVSAVSSDLMSWERTDLALAADPALYEQRHWRDPWVVWDEGSQLWRMYVTTRLLAGPSGGRGAIASMTSLDLLAWNPAAAVAAPGQFRQMEVPQIVPCGDRYGLLFCASDTDHSPSRLARGVLPEFGTHVLYGDDLAGPFVLESDAFLSGDNGPSLYAGRAIEHDGRWWFLAWERLGPDGGFVGAVSDPFPLHISEGRFVIDFATAESSQPQSPQATALGEKGVAGTGV